MFYRKNLYKKTTKTYKINYNSFASGMNTDIDENLLSHNKAKLCYNYSIKNGALKTGLGFSDLKLPVSDAGNAQERSLYLAQGTDFKGVWHFKYYSQTYASKQHYLVYYGSDKQLYWCKLISVDPYSFSVDSTDDYNHIPNALSYRLNGSDVMIFTSPEDDMWVFPPEGAVSKISTAPKIVSMCLHYERLFAIVEGERNEIRFSDDLDPTNWTTSPTEGGYIQMIDDRGPLSKVVSFNDYVYVIRDFGIARISAYGEQSDFSVSQVYSSSGKIYADSAQVCGERIMFLSKNGIHSFDGISASKLDLNIDKLFDGIINDKCCSAYHNGKYYLACKLNFSDSSLVGCEAYASGYINNALIELDLNSGDMEITRGVDIISLTSIEEGYMSKLVACFNGEHSTRLGMLTNDGKIFGTTLKKVWLSPKSNLGFAGKKKVIKEINLVTSGDLTINIKTEDKDKTYLIEGSFKNQRICPKITCEQVQLTLESMSDLNNISAPQIVLSVESQ